MEEDADQETISSQPALDFIDSSSLTYFIPQATKFKLEDEFDEDSRNCEEVFKSIERREALFFDETADVYLVLRTAYVPEATLKSYLQRLVITLETHITSGSRDAPDRDIPNGNSEIIYSGTVDGESGEDPVILADKAKESENEKTSASGSESESGDDDARHIYAVWKLSVFLGRPRMRLQSPSAIFTGTASLKPPPATAATADPMSSLALPLSPTKSTTNGVPRDDDRSGGSGSGSGSGSEYMASGVPSGLNLLEAFGDDPALNGVRPRLSALRVSRVAPVTQQAKDLLRPIRAHPKQLTLRVYPAVHSRIRFSRPHAHTATPPGSSGAAAIIAMLEIDFTSFFECEILLNSIDVSVRGSSGSNSGVTIDDLTGGGLSMPLSCVAHDHVTFLYRIAPAAAEEDMLRLAAGSATGAAAAVSKQPSRELAIKIGATALAQPGICEPTLRMAWSATVDFTLPLNPGYGPALQPIQRAHRPSQLSIGGGAEAAASLITTAVSRPDSIPSLEAAAARSRETSLPELGITVTFAAPPPTQKIYPGDAFAWTVFVVNRGPAAAAPVTAAGAGAAGGGPPTPGAPPRKLALVAIPRRRRHDARVNRPPSVSSSSQVAVPFPGGGGGGSISYGHGGHGHIHGHSYTQGYGYDKRASVSTALQPTTRSDRTVADAVLDDAVVHAMQRGSGMDYDGAAAPLASLSADVRVGPLAPGACHAAELRFLALRPGVHAVEAVRVVDLGSNEHVDVRELPTVVVEAR